MPLTGYYAPLPFAQAQQQGLLAAQSPYDVGSLGLLSQEAYNLADPKYYQPRGAVPFTMGPGYTPPDTGGGDGSGVGGTLGGLLAQNPNLLTDLIGRLFPTQPGDPNNTAGDQQLQQDVGNSSADISAGIAAGIPGLLDLLNPQPVPPHQGSSDIAQTDPGAGPTYQTGGAAPAAPAIADVGGLLDALIPTPTVPQQQGGSDVTQVDNQTFQPLTDQPTYQTPIIPAAATVAPALPGLLAPAPATAIEATQLPEWGLGQIPSSTAGTAAGVGGGLSAAGALASGDAALAASVASTQAGINAGLLAGTPWEAAGAGAGAAAPSAFSTVLGNIAFPLAAAATLYNIASPYFGSNSVTLGEPNQQLGQYNVPLQSGQSSLAAGKIAYGGGNNASEGSGQWFWVQPDGTPYWMGEQDTQELNGLFNMMPRTADHIATDGGPIVSNFDENGQPMVFDPAIEGGAAKGAAQRIYDKYGGQSAWGTDLDTWINQWLGVRSNVSGRQSQLGDGG